MENLEIFITLIVSDIGNSVYLLEIFIKHSIHCLQFNRLANFLNNQIRNFKMKSLKCISPISIVCKRKGSKIHIFLMLI